MAEPSVMRNAVSPVSSEASRMAATSGVSPGWMLPAGTCRPDSSRGSSRCLKTSTRPSRTDVADDLLLPRACRHRGCSSILPWRSCGIRDPWTGSTTAEKTESAIASIEAVAPTVWGGDWNHAMSGREWSGSQQGRRAILEAVDRLGLQFPTASAPHQIDELWSIDHIAVPAFWTVLGL